MSKLLAPFALILVALLVVVWLDDTPQDADLVFVNQNEAFTLDPQRMSYIQDLRLAHILYEGLVRWDNHDYSILPAVADLPTVSEDGLTYTFEIRPDAHVTIAAVGATFVGKVRVVFDDLCTGVGSEPRPRSYSDRNLVFAKGEEWGRFEFGSTLVMVATPGALRLDARPSGTPLRLGTRIGSLGSTTR